MNSKIISTFFLLVLLAISAFIAGYYFSGKSSTVSDILSSDILSKFETVGARSPALSQDYDPKRSFSSAKATSLMLSSNADSILYYEKNTGRVINLNYKTGSESAVSNNNLPNFISTIWSPDSTEVITSFYEPSGNIYKYYNFNTKKSVALLRTIKSLAFSPDGKHIVYFLEGDDSNSLYLSHPDGSNPKKLLSTRLTGVTLFWPSPDFIYIQSSSASDSTESLFRVSLSGDLAKIIDGGMDMQILFSKSGRNLLFSYIYGEQRLTGFISNLGSEQYIETVFKANACAWSIDEITLYCALTSDSGSNIVSYNITTNALTPIGPIPFNGSVESILLSPAEDYLILLNKSDSKIYVFTRKAL